MGCKVAELSGINPSLDSTMFSVEFVETNKRRLLCKIPTRFAYRTFFAILTFLEIFFAFLFDMVNTLNVGIQIKHLKRYLSFFASGGKYIAKLYLSLFASGKYNTKQKNNNLVTESTKQKK